MLHAIELGAPIRQSWELHTDDHDRTILRVRDRYLTPRIIALINHLQNEPGDDDGLARGAVPFPRATAAPSPELLAEVRRDTAEIVSRIVGDLTQRGNIVIVTAPEA